MHILLQNVREQRLEQFIGVAAEREQPRAVVRVLQTQTVEVTQCYVVGHLHSVVYLLKQRKRQLLFEHTALVFYRQQLLNV